MAGRRPGFSAAEPRPVAPRRAGRRRPVIGRGRGECRTLSVGGRLCPRPPPAAGEMGAEPASRGGAARREAARCEAVGVRAAPRAGSEQSHQQRDKVTAGREPLLPPRARARGGWKGQRFRLGFVFTISSMRIYDHSPEYSLRILSRLYIYIYNLYKYMS